MNTTGANDHHGSFWKMYKIIWTLLRSRVIIEENVCQLLVPMDIMDHESVYIVWTDHYCTGAKNYYGANWMNIIAIKDHDGSFGEMYKRVIADKYWWV